MGSAQFWVGSFLQMVPFDPQHGVFGRLGWPFYMFSSQVVYLVNSWSGWLGTCHLSQWSDVKVFQYWVTVILSFNGITIYLQSFGRVCAGNWLFGMVLLLYFGKILQLSGHQQSMLRMLLIGVLVLQLLQWIYNRFKQLGRYAERWRFKDDRWRNPRRSSPSLFPRMRLTMWLHMVGISNMMMQRTGFPTDLGYNFNLYLSQQLIDHGKWLVVGSGWDKRACILEARATLFAVKHMVRSSSNFGKRMLAFFW